MSIKIRDSELRDLPEPERKARLDKLLREAAKLPVDDQLAEINEQIRACEAATRLDSTTVRQDLEEGRIAETDEVCRLLMLVAIRDELESVAARPR